MQFIYSEIGVLFGFEKSLDRIKIKRIENKVPCWSEQRFKELF